MKAIYTITICLLVQLLLYSCAPGPAEKKFPETKNVTADYIGIDELLQVNNIVKLEDYIILQNASDAVDDFYFVYSYPEFEFLYSFARRGRGPNEYMFPSVIKNTEGNILAFRDHGNDMLAFYEITGTEAELIDSFPFKSEDNRFFWEMNCVGDSMMLVKHQDYKTGARELWNPYDKTLIDSIPNTFDKLPRKMGKNYFTIFDDYLISASDNRFAIAYFLIDRIELGRIDNGQIYLESSIGVTSPSEFHHYGHREVKDFNIDKNIVYYENLYAGHNAVYALYSNGRLDDTEKSHSSLMEVYSWDGEPVCLLELEHPLAYFTVDEDTRTIYGVNPSMYEDKIIVYKY